MTDTEHGNLYDYTERNPPDVLVHSAIHHPTKVGTVIGHVGYDTGRRQKAAVFPRRRDDHYFRKYDGYGISASVLDGLRPQNVQTVYIVERDKDNRVLEFRFEDFYDGELVAYLPEADTIIEDSETIRVIEREQTLQDKQFVLAESRALHLWDRNDCTIKRTD